MRRRFLFLVLGLFAAVLLAVATLPLWLGAAVRGVAAPRGLTFQRYERIGYARFALHGVEFRRDNVRVTLDRAEAPTPLLWGWRHWRGDGNPVVAGKWLVEVTKSSTPPKPNVDRGWTPLRGQLQRIAGALDRWLPQATLGAGIVRFPGGELTLRSARWGGRTLEVSELAFRNLAADATVAFPTAERLTVSARASDGTAVALASDGADVRGEATWSGQRATLEARFAARGWLPETATVRAPQWTLPGERLKLGEIYAQVKGDAEIAWREERFRAVVQAAGEPLPGKAAPPLAIDLRGQGDAQAFTVEALQVDIPGVKARLSEPVTIGRDGRLRGEGGRLAVQADLARQPWFTAAGAVEGTARVTSGEDGRPRVDFELTARGVAAKDIDVSEIAAQGALVWPRLEIPRGTIVGGAGERLTLKGGWDFKTKELVETALEGEIRRASLARWLPQQPGFEAVRIAARASGPLAELRHGGNLAATAVTFPGVAPLAVRGEWEGRGAGADRLEAEIAAGASRIVARGAVNREALQLGALTFTQGDELRLKLAAPATVRWKPQLNVQDLQLNGPQGTLSLSATLGETGEVNLAAGNLSSRWFSDFVAEKGPPWQVTLLALMGTWDRGPMTFSLTAGAAVKLGEGRTASVHASANGDAQGIQIQALRATEADATVVNATGRLPITVRPGTPQLVRIDEDGPIELNATAAPNAVFWQKLAALSGVELKEPEAQAALKGTWSKPEGGITLKAARLALDPQRFTRPLPAIEGIDVRVAGDRGGVVLERFAFSVEGQAVQAKGRLPVGDGKWSAAVKEPLALAQRGADLELEVRQAEVAAFARFLPAVLAPKGTVKASVRLRNGELGGFVRLEGAASRPLGPLGVLQEIAAEIELKGRTLVLRELAARSGGQPVALSGTIELPEPGAGAAGAAAKPAALPKFDLTLKGENLPFVRQTGLLLRGDLDLKLQTPSSGPVRLSGTVRLRDSLFLSDVRSFLPKGGASASRRPPYFSVDTPPMNGWTLAVEVVGEKFMRLRTPVFSGVASARFRLGGTLGEPRAIGDVDIEEGAVQMPFARFEVQQGSVRLSESDPFEPTIYLRGTGRRYGYDLALEIEGKASAPNVVFSSSPALESEQVLLMVMTGSAPSNTIAVTGTQRVTQLGTFVGQNLLGSFLSDGADADRLSITSGEKISRQGNETYDVEYKLSDKWTVTGEYNEFDEYNVGMKWRVFRGQPKQAKPEGKGEK